MRNAQHSVAGQLQVAVSYPVPLESGPRAVEPVRVELDYEPLVVPEHVDLLRSDPGVEGWKGKIGRAAKVGERALELGAGERSIAVSIQRGMQRA